MLKVWVRLLLVGVFGTATMFLLVSLLSYNAHDPSLFYYTTHKAPIANWCGTPGCYVASFLYHVLGYAAYVMIGVGLFCTLLLIYGISLKREWDRLGALIFLISISAVIMQRYHYDGGYIGKKLHTILVSVFDSIGSGVFIYAALIMCYVLIVRLFFFRSISFLSNKLIHVIRQHYFGQWYQRIRVLVTTASALVWKTGISIKHFLDGSTLEQEPSLMEFEYDIDHTQEPAFDFKNSIRTHTIEETPFIYREHKEDRTEQIHHSTSEPTHMSGAMPELEEKIKAVTSTAQVSHYVLPGTDIFIVNEEQDVAVQMNILKQQSLLLEEKLQHFSITGKVVSIKSGPVVTLFEYQPEIDAKISKIISLEDDLALALQALSIRIIAPIPGRSVVGFEVANKERKDVKLASIMKSVTYQKFNGLLPLVLGKDTMGGEVIVDLATMPHLLVAGSTGSGKSVALNTMLMSLLCKYSPDNLNLILVDPKRLEFSAYADIAHLLFPIITHPRDVSPALRWVIEEMERRYELLAEYGARNIHDYYRHAGSADESLPFIVIVIDELADVMMTTSREVEGLITRIAQMARAAGIHMIVATQRPSVDVITGLIKVNFPSRISFRVSSKVDSRTILDDIGAEKLLGRGDMLFLNASAVNLCRVHGAYVSDKEIEQVTNHVRAQRTVQYREPHGEINDEHLSGEDDILYQQVLEFLKQVDDISISLLQRKFRIGYNRSARVIERLEAQGIVSPPIGGKTRKIIR